MTTPTLLGYLAQFGSFSRQSEVLCTQALTYLLQTYDEARSALAEELAIRTGVSIGAAPTWRAEALQDDRGRSDLEACKSDGVPVVKMEAKLGAQLTEAQLQSYVADLLRRNDGDTALIVLVPKGRTGEAARVTAAALGLSGSGPWRLSDGHRCGVAVISWDELFAVLRAGKLERFRHELEQLQAMYRVLSGDYIALLASAEDLLQWRAREADFLNLVDEVTRRLTTEHRVYPMAEESLDGAGPEHEPIGYYRRYVCSTHGGVASCFAIGVRDSFAEFVTPVWMRFRHDTGHFEQVCQRVQTCSTRGLISGKDLWIPLKVPLDISRDQMIQALVQQAEAVRRIAYDSSTLLDDVGVASFATTS